MVGMLIKNANFEVSFRFKPISNAPVMAIPDLEAPGKIANAWKQPIIKAAVKVNSAKDFVWVEDLKAKYNKTANMRFVHAIEFRLANLESVKSEKNNPAMIIGRVATKGLTPTNNFADLGYLSKVSMLEPSPEFLF